MGNEKTGTDEIADKLSKILEMVNNFFANLRQRKVR